MLNIRKFRTLFLVGVPVVMCVVLRLLLWARMTGFAYSGGVEVVVIMVVVLAFGAAHDGPLVHYPSFWCLPVGWDFDELVVG